jgi:hypothetical protein
MRGAGLGVGALGLGGVVVGAVFLSEALSTQSEADELNDTCGKSCSSAQQSAVRALDVDAAHARTGALIGLAAGGVALAAGVTLIVLGKPRSKTTGVTMTPWFSSDMGGVRGTF